MDSLDRYWGKAAQPDQGAGDAFHLFVLHCLDVAAVADAWLDASRSLQRQLDASGPSGRAWLLFFIALHDLGKLDVGFQVKAPAAVAALDPYPSDARSHLPTGRYWHGPEGYRLAFRELSDWLGVSDEDELFEECRDAWEPWLAAVTGHHGIVPFDTAETSGPGQLPRSLIPPSVREADRLARRAWVRRAAELFLHPAGLDLRSLPPSASPLLAGFCSVCDWLGSNTDYFAYVGRPVDYRIYLDERAVPAARILRDSGLCRGTLAVGGMPALFPDKTPRQVQTLVDGIPLEPGLTLIEAPTGCGKTEAALAYASHLLAAGLTDSVVFALPTQATANAMLGRLEAVAPKLFTDGNANLVLAHGKSRFNPDFIDLKRAATARTAQTDEAERDAYVQCAQWLGQSRKRAFLGQIGVCTVDQVLMGVLPVKHGFVRTFGVGRSVLIVDEVHAYDRYMYGLLKTVLERQREADGTAVLLSATLPLHQRRRLVAAWRKGTALAADAPYPLVTHVASAGGTVALTPARAQRPDPRAVAVRCVETSQAFPTDGVRQALVDAARAGARVAVVCNLVDEAQRLTRELRAAAPDVAIDLFHARYRFCDRLEHERRVLALYGPEARHDRGRILVATQVVEQSLDLDFDWLVTQLCPADLLFQRLGRLHRHPRPRPPGFERPCCTVLIPTEADFGRHRWVYSDRRALWRTVQLLRGTKVAIRFPRAYREWVEQVYAEEPWHDEPAAIDEAWQTYDAEQRAAWKEALRRTRERRNPFADTDEVIQILTRDGDPSLPVLPLLGGSAGPTLLDGRSLAELEDWQCDEAIELNTVAVPKTWKKRLPPIADERYEVVMQPAGSETWLAEYELGSLRYSIEFGLEFAAG